MLVNPEIDIFLAAEIICAELPHCADLSEQAQVDLYLHAKAVDLPCFEWGRKESFLTGGAYDDIPASLSGG